MGGTGIWVLPNPSGLNAHYQLPALIAEFARLHRIAAAAPPPTGANVPFAQ
jgi:double-stranded uracil-DNA glycosylase